MSKKGSVVGDRPRLRKYKITLENEYLMLRDAKEFSSVENLGYIIDEVKALNSTLKYRLIDAKIIKKEADIDENLKCFYGKFFNSFDNNHEIFDWLLDNSEDYFFARKIHQLSHAKGEYKDNISTQKEVPEDIKNYFLFLLYLDYYETFPVYLRPMIKRLIDNKKWTKLIDRKNTRKWYVTYDQIVPNLVIDLKKIDNIYNDLRNKIAHSNILFLFDSILYNNQEKNEIDFQVEKIKQDINIFQNNVMIFATEFDIRMLELGLDGEDIYFDNWFRYFEIYNEDWQRIGPNIHDDEAW